MARLPQPAIEHQRRVPFLERGHRTCADPPTVLRRPDYGGNAIFNTLGNIEVNPAAGLPFPDWETGGCLQLTGTATVDWDAGRAASVPGAERLVEFTVRQVVDIPGGSPLRWTGPEYSRFNPATAPTAPA